MLHVDLKTIHNWVAAGHLRGRRTEGRHLRFGRPEIVRFMRQFGYPVPPPLTHQRPRVLVIVDGRDRTPARRDWDVAHGPFTASLQLGAGAHEVAVAHLGAFSSSSIASWVAAVRSHDVTECVGLVGVGDSPQRRRAFLAAGGDAALPPNRAAALTSVIGWLTGAIAAPPRGIEIAET